MVLCLGGFLTYAAVDFPDWGDPASPASLYVSPHYIEKSIEETSIPNVVTAILADYRGFDTMFETTVILGAGLACFLILRPLVRSEPRERMFRHMSTGIVIRTSPGDHTPADSRYFNRIDETWTPHDVIVKTVCRLMVPFMQLFALYVIAHGHHSPGGGFQGGVIMGAGFILLAISYDLRTLTDMMAEKTVIMLAASGVLIYAGVGAACLAEGGYFLDYGALSGLLGVDPVQARGLGVMFVEIGVALAVMATMVLIYLNVSSAGQLREGL